MTRTSYNRVRDWLRSHGYIHVRYIKPIFVENLGMDTKGDIWQGRNTGFDQWKTIGSQLDVLRMMGVRS